MKLFTIQNANRNVCEGSHLADDYKTSSIAPNFRETVELNSDTTGYFRYDNAWYPRIKKVREDLYLLLYMYGELGPHLYFVTSRDGVHWEEPQVLYDNRAADKTVTYTDGPLTGVTDRYCAVNADACVLQNGEVLCVYWERPHRGYHGYIDHSCMYLRRGTVTAEHTLLWSEPRKIYVGSGWEPFIHQREDGQIEVYWSSIVAYHSMYGFDKEKRSTCTMMIVSNDNGETWMPDVRAGDTNHHVATRVFQQYIGDRVPYGHPELSPVPYFGGQMPSAARLCNGKTMLAIEVHTIDYKFKISHTVSGAGGNWKPLALTEAGPEGSVYTAFSGASPYLCRFPSGEVYMTYTRGRDLRYRMCAPDGSEAFPEERFAAPGTYGIWGSCLLDGGHTVITAAQNKNGEKWGIRLTHGYLNHRIDALRYGAWDEGADALFVGGASQAQITLRAAYDDVNLYLRIDRLDDHLTDGDTATVRLASDGAVYTVTVGNDGLIASDLDGVSAVTTVACGGCVSEIALPRAALGESIAVCPALDEDGTVHDTIHGAEDPALWPAVKLV